MIDQNIRTVKGITHKARTRYGQAQEEKKESK